ncbi:MAG: ArsB/NhaD family transporter [Alphaproteobacteria bacterium]|nr:ArsB/NhaD family transporter [Alphaproteobacteria bacterium]
MGDALGAPQGVFGLDALWVATTILVATYVGVIVDHVNRAIAALLGAGLMIVLGVLNQETAVRGIDFNTIALLTGMMLIVGITRRCGIFEYVAIAAAQGVRGNPAAVLLLLSIVTAMFSALLDNVTTVLLIVPVTLAITRELKVPAYPFLFAEVLASNIGGTATLIGDPPNIIIGSAAHLSFNDFVVHLTPVIVAVMVVQAAITHALWGRQLHTDPEHRRRVMAMAPRASIVDARLLKQSLAVLGAVIVAFVLARRLHQEPGTIAMLGAAVLLLLDNLGRTPEAQDAEIHRTFSEVEWITLFFFIGLFIVVAGGERAGLLRWLADRLMAATGGDRTTTVLAILWGSAILSAVVDNIPFVATMIPLIKTLAPTFGGPEGLMPLWWALSLGACLGGNGTLIGASANLTVAGLAERAGVRFRFLTFSAYAFPMMLVSVAICHVYVWWRYL